MPAGGRASSRAVELQDEFSGPVGYADRWLWIALGLMLVAALYFALAWWLTRPPTVRSVTRADVDVPSVRGAHLERIDRIAAQVAAGAIAARDGHQQLSVVVRSYVAAVSTLPARTMALADFRTHAPAPVADTIAVLYPPEFAPDDEVARTRFDEAADRARELVTTWA